jgi:hypothetical protein
MGWKYGSELFICNCQSVFKGCCSVSGGVHLRGCCCCCRLHGTSWVADKDMQPLKTASLFANAMPTWVQHILG